MKIFAWLGLLAIALSGAIIPLGIVREQRIEGKSYPLSGGELRITFSPSFHRENSQKWPPIDVAGNPFDLGIMWVSPHEQPGVRLQVNSLRLRGENVTNQVLAPQSKIGSTRNADDKFYTVVMYKNVSIPVQSLMEGIVDCTLKFSDGRSIDKNFRFEIQNIERDHWVNRVFESFKGH